MLIDVLLRDIEIYEICIRVFPNEYKYHYWNSACPMLFV